MNPTTITRQVDLDTPADELWELVSDPDQLATWLGDSVDVDVRPGGTGTVVDDDIVRVVEVEEVSESRRVSFTWWESGDRSTASRVEFAIGTTDDGRSRLTITETLPDQAPPMTARASVARMRWEVRVLSLWVCTVALASMR
ncbi:MAG: SRPBCC domain-containing protein [Acidimicrobiales bacterium]